MSCSGIFIVGGELYWNLHSGRGGVGDFWKLYEVIGFFLPKSCPNILYMHSLSNTAIMIPLLYQPCRKSSKVVSQLYSSCTKSL